MLHWETRSKYKQSCCWVFPSFPSTEQQLTLLLAQTGACCRARMGLGTHRADTGYLNEELSCFQCWLLTKTRARKALSSLGPWRAAWGKRLVSVEQLGGTHNTSPKH